MLLAAHATLEARTGFTRRTGKAKAEHGPFLFVSHRPARYGVSLWARRLLRLQVDLEGRLGNLGVRGTIAGTNQVDGMCWVLAAGGQVVPRVVRPVAGDALDRHVCVLLYPVDGRHQRFAIVIVAR